MKMKNNRIKDESIWIKAKQLIDFQSNQISSEVDFHFSLRRK